MIVPVLLTLFNVAHAEDVAPTEEAEVDIFTTIDNVFG